MEFHLHAKHYKLHGNEGSIPKEGELGSCERRKKHKTIYKNKSKARLYTRRIKIIKLTNQVQIIQGMMHILQKNLANV